jgi:uncharacterized protein (DUF2336 family)
VGTSNKRVIFVPTHFRALEIQGNSDRKDEILRAAVSAFVALTKPVRRDINQIEDLVLPILPFASVSAKRFASAALAESTSAPVSLIKTLCAEGADICAPLLLKSPVLMPVDLVSIIGKHGKEHARIISCRRHLPNDVIEALALVDDEVVQDRISDTRPHSAQDNIKPANAAEARQMLLEMATSIAQTEPASEGKPASKTGGLEETNNPERLVRLSLHEKPELLATALADGLGLPVSRCLRFMRRNGSGELITALKALHLNSDQAFVILCALNPMSAASKADIRLMKDRFDAMELDKACDTVRLWKADEIAMEFVKSASYSHHNASSLQTLKAS